MHKIGIISDTHGLLRQEVVDMLQDCEAILHGGDFGTGKILETLEQIAPVYAVRGNNDDWVEEPVPLHASEKPCFLPEALSIELYGVRFFMVHNKKMVPKDMSAFDIIIYGHSHMYEEKYAGRQLWLNPGSCGPRRFTLPVTMALLEITEDGAFQVGRVDLENHKVKTSGTKALNQHSDIRRIIELVVKDTKKGIAVNKIAERHGIRLELAEQICRLYLTHPGVDTDGIMRKMGI